MGREEFTKEPAENPSIVPMSAPRTTVPNGAKDFCDVLARVFEAPVRGKGSAETPG